MIVHYTMNKSWHAKVSGRIKCMNQSNMNMGLPVRDVPRVGADGVGFDVDDEILRSFT